VTSFRVVVTDTAERHLETIRAWWALNRGDAPLLLVEEIETAFERICRAPHSGAFYRQATTGTEKCAASCSVARVTMSTQNGAVQRYPRRAVLSLSVPIADN
jgi:plasmid stabilization system protein ParE